MMKKRIIMCTVLSVAILLLAGCGRKPVLEGIDFSGLPEEMAVGDTVDLKISYQWDQEDEEIQQEQLDKALEELTLEYASSNEEVAQVEDGTVTATGAGEATITVTCGEFTADQTVTVVIPVEEITITEISVTLGDDPVPVEFSVTPENYTGELIWTVENEDIAQLDQETMELTFSAEGETTLTAQAPNGVERTASIVVAPKPAPGSGSTGGSSGSGSSGSTGGSSGSDSSSSSGFQTGSVRFELSPEQWGWMSIEPGDPEYEAVAYNINLMRREAGLPELTVDSSLSAIATSRCEYQVINNTFTHDGMQTAGEILGQNYNSAAAVCEAWKNSSGHYAAITNESFTTMGIGCAFERGGLTIWCVVFN